MGTCGESTLGQGGTRSARVRRGAYRPRQNARRLVLAKHHLPVAGGAVTVTGMRRARKERKLIFLPAAEVAATCRHQAGHRLAASAGGGAAPMGRLHTTRANVTAAEKAPARKEKRPCCPSAPQFTRIAQPPHPVSWDVAGMA